jgi:hypothetical protein
MTDIKTDYAVDIPKTMTFWKKNKKTSNVSN